MASESTVLPNARAVAETSDSQASGRARNNDRRVPTARETLRTLPEPAPNEADFEPHDTIPAPPWLDDEILPEAPRKSPQ